MRKLRSIAATLLVTAVCSQGSSDATAGEYDALLADLSFSAVPSYARDAPPTLQPAEPSDLMGGLQTAPSRRIASRDQGEAHLMPPSVKTKSDPSKLNERFDLDAAIAASQLGQSQTQATSVGCRSASPVCGNGSCDGACDGSGCDGMCNTPVASCGNQCGGCRCDQGEQWQCVAKRPVNLPRSSFYQYFNARPSDVGVWDGYAQRPCKLYEGDPPAHGHRCMCSGCGGCGEVLDPCRTPTRVARLPKIQMPEVRLPIRQIQPSCDSCDSCD